MSLNNNIYLTSIHDKTIVLNINNVYLVFDGEELFNLRSMLEVRKVSKDISVRQYSESELLDISILNDTIYFKTGDTLLTSIKYTILSDFVMHLDSILYKDELVYNTDSKAIEYKSYGPNVPTVREMLDILKDADYYIPRFSYLELLSIPDSVYKNINSAEEFLNLLKNMEVT